MSRAARLYLAALVSVVSAMALVGSFVARHTAQAIPYQASVSARQVALNGAMGALPTDTPCRSGGGDAQHGYAWRSGAATAASATGGDAFAAGSSLEVCGANAPASRVIPLVSTSDAAVVWAEVDYPRPPSLVQLFVLGAASSVPDRWTLLGGFTLTRPNPAALPSSAAQVASWLPLPSGPYVGNAWPETWSQVGRGPSVGYLQWWVSASGEYVAGHYAGAISPMAGAATRSIGGYVGWIVESGGHTSGPPAERADFMTVYVPLADGTISFFAGTGSRENVVTLAAAALPHFSATQPPWN